MIVCQGCGQAVPVPSGYRRTKIQCPACGVICPVPEDRDEAPARRTPAAKETPRAEVSFDPGEPSPPPPAPPEQPRELPITCRRCGRKIRRQRECPDCDAIVPAAPAMELDDDEDASPYLVAGGLPPRCPECNKELTDGAVLCLACGFDLRRRKQARRSYEPIDLAWDTDYSLSGRLLVFGIVQGIHWSLALASAPTEVGFLPFVVAWPLLTLLLAFVLGTFESGRLQRDRRGRVRLTRQWRFFFLPGPPAVTEVRGFEGVLTGQWHDAGFLEYLVFGSLLCSGVIPALVYWYYAIYKAHYHVALARDHGHATVWVYRGRSPEQMSLVAETLCNASGLQRLA